MVERSLTPVDVDSICDIRKNYSKIASEFKETIRKSAIVDYRNRSIILEEELRITRQKGRESFMYHWYKTAILNRALTKVHGTAWYCKMELRKRTYRTSFLGDNFFTDEVTVMKFDYNDCEVMRITKSCGKNQEAIK